MAEREFRNVNDLIPYANNPRINMNAVPKVAESIRRFGFLGDVVIDSKGVIVAGHTRVLACKLLLERGDCGLWGNGKLNELAGTGAPPEPQKGRYQSIAPFVPVICADHLTDDELRAFRIADNRTNELSDWDYDLLAQEIDLLADADIDMTALGLDDIPLAEFGEECVDLDDAMGEDFQLPTGEKSDTEQIAFILTSEQANVVRDALDRVDYDGEGNRNGGKIAEVCRQWLAQRT